MTENAGGPDRKPFPAAGAAWFGIFQDAAPAHRMMTVIVVAVVLASWFLGEHVPVSGGLGWDGVIYADLVRNMGHTGFSTTLGTYYAQRILPAFLVRQGLLLFSSDMANRDIILGFAILNGLMCVGLTEVWRSICNILKLTVISRWFGFAGMFMSFEFSKQTMFYPVLTDPVALFLAAMLLLTYLKRSKFAVSILSIIGAFCWPTLSITGAILCMFMPNRPYDPASPYSAEYQFGKNTLKVGLWIIAGVAIFSAICAIPASHQACVALSGPINIASYLPASLAAKAQASHSLKDPCLIVQQGITAVPSFLLMILAMIILVVPLVRTGILPLKVDARRITAICCAVFIVLVSWLGVRVISNPHVANPSSIFVLARLSGMPAVGKVFLPFVSLSAFWGALAIFSAVEWPKIASEARHMGGAIVAVLCFTLPFGLVGEPRFLTTIWPILVTLAAIVLGRFNRNGRNVVLLVSTFVMAQFWLPLTIVPWSGGAFASLEDFPKQLYFMHYGLWTSWTGYGIQAAILVGIAWALARSAKADLADPARNDLQHTGPSALG
ncbi:hypothetical protein [Sphingomonas sp. TREG-RG-20F-R18-01]|uniref:hypothetical protein n=1 Tax=Sphingomonas sp. TREG-RG-20F-R18-01 TaxID=2914982 RepID=UPI001F596200|nr:hypothetical protein [Sphingomonas sp. TREG-RG-20F-R18-01]